MIKYVISTGRSVLSDILYNKQKEIDYTFSNIAEKAIKFDKIGDAMDMASRVNKMINGYNCKVILIEINK